MRSGDWACLVGTLFSLSLELPHKIRFKSYKLTLGFLISTCLLSNITRCQPNRFSSSILQYELSGALAWIPPT